MRIIGPYVYEKWRTLPVTIAYLLHIGQGHIKLYCGPGCCDKMPASVKHIYLFINMKFVQSAHKEKKRDKT